MHEFIELQGIEGFSVFVHRLSISAFGANLALDKQGVWAADGSWIILEGGDKLIVKDCLLGVMTKVSEAWEGANV
jgi:hypothetical protein